MNKYFAIGRLTGDPEIRRTQDGLAVARFNLAVNRAVAKGDQKADFPRCVAFGKKAEIAEKYLTKGKRIAIVGRIQTDSYKDKDGKTVYTTDVVVEDIEFVESKPQTESKPVEQVDEFIPVPEGEQEELPFN